MLIVSTKQTKIHPNRITSQANLSPHEGVLEDYNELVVQFGYVTLFCSAFPLAPLLALLNNLIALKTDAFSILTHQRTHYRGAKGMGVWFKLLEFISYSSIAVNFAMIAFTKVHDQERERVFHSSFNSLLIIAREICIHR